MDDRVMRARLGVVPGDVDGLGEESDLVRGCVPTGIVWVKTSVASPTPSSLKISERVIDAFSFFFFVQSMVRCRFKDALPPD